MGPAQRNFVHLCVWNLEWLKLVICTILSLFYSSLIMLDEILLKFAMAYQCQVYVSFKNIMGFFICLGAKYMS